jgi:hypothetical protein
MEIGPSEAKMLWTQARPPRPEGVKLVLSGTH